MLSFNQLQEKKTKVKINPKKEDVMEGDKTLNHGDDCNCMKCDKKRRKDDLGDEKTGRGHCRRQSPRGFGCC